MVMSRIRVEAPPVPRLPFGLFSVAQMVETPEGSPFRPAMAGTEFESSACQIVRDTGGACDFARFSDVTLSFEVDDAGALSIAAVENFPEDPNTTNMVAIDPGTGDENDTYHGPLPGVGDPVFTYTTPGVYIVTTTWGVGFEFTAVTTVTVTAGVATGPFDAVVDPAHKNFTGARNESLPVDPFTLYQGLYCRTVGTLDTARQWAEDSFRAGEQAAAETVLSAALVAHAYDATPGADALSVADALALAEGIAADNGYKGVPLIHVNRVLGSLLGTLGAVSRYGDRLETPQGALVSSGGGYRLADPADGVAPFVGDADSWLYVTGAIRIDRGNVTTIGPSINGAGLLSNEYETLAERPYAVAIDCFVAAIRVSTSISTTYAASTP